MGALEELWELPELRFPPLMAACFHALEVGLLPMLLVDRIPAPSRYVAKPLPGLLVALFLLFVLDEPEQALDAGAAEPRHMARPTRHHSGGGGDRPDRSRDGQETMRHRRWRQ